MSSWRFKRPTKKERLRAALASRTEKLDEVPLAFTPVPESAFKPISKPKGVDWLREQKERGQSFISFERGVFKAVPHGKFTVIELVPIGPVPNLEEISRFTAAFISPCTCRVAKAIPLSEASSSSREGDEGQLQLKCSTVYKALKKRKMTRGSARDVLVTIGVTMADLYPGEGWNFVYGQADIVDGLGVFSFSRYNDNGYVFQWGDDLKKASANQVQPDGTVDSKLLYRSCKVLTHEAGHLFGMLHCTFYECLMCGCNHLEEFDKRPMYLCPVDLRKLQSSLKFDVAIRYKNLLEIVKIFGWEDLAGFYHTRLTELVGDYTKYPRIAQLFNY
uniref:Archaemetzincin-2 n=1 Tax=Lotharella globosa TaxID=91324 RepID=A0A7S4DMS1_9EUKA